MISCSMTLLASNMSETSEERSAGNVSVEALPGVDLSQLLSNDQALSILSSLLQGNIAHLDQLKNKENNTIQADDSSMEKVGGTVEASNSSCPSVAAFQSSASAQNPYSQSHVLSEDLVSSRNDESHTSSQNLQKLYSSLSSYPHNPDTFKNTPSPLLVNNDVIATDPQHTKIHHVSQTVPSCVPSCETVKLKGIDKALSGEPAKGKTHPDGTSCGLGCTSGCDSACMRISYLQLAKSYPHTVGVKFDPTCPRWIAHWKKNGHRFFKSFSVQKNGFQQAWRMAVQCRKDNYMQKNTTKSTSKTSAEQTVDDATFENDFLRKPALKAFDARRRNTPSDKNMKAATREQKNVKAKNEDIELKKTSPKGRRGAVRGIDEGTASSYSTQNDNSSTSLSDILKSSFTVGNHAGGRKRVASIAGIGVQKSSESSVQFPRGKNNRVSFLDASIGFLRKDISSVDAENDDGLPTEMQNGKDSECGMFGGNSTVNSHSSDLDPSIVGSLPVLQMETRDPILLPDNHQHSLNSTISSLLPSTPSTPTTSLSYQTITKRKSYNETAFRSPRTNIASFLSPDTSGYSHGTPSTKDTFVNFDDASDNAHPNKHVCTNTGSRGEGKLERRKSQLQQHTLEMDLDQEVNFSSENDGSITLKKEQNVKPFQRDRLSIAASSQISTANASYIKGDLAHENVEKWESSTSGERITLAKMAITMILKNLRDSCLPLVFSFLSPSSCYESQEAYQQLLQYSDQYRRLSLCLMLVSNSKTESELCPFLSAFSSLISEQQLPGILPQEQQQHLIEVSGALSELLIARNETVHKASVPKDGWSISSPSQTVHASLS